MSRVPPAKSLIEYFKNTTDFNFQPPIKTQVIENIWQNMHRDYHVRILAKRLRWIDKAISRSRSLIFLSP